MIKQKKVNSRASLARLNFRWGTGANNLSATRLTYLLINGLQLPGPWKRPTCADRAGRAGAVVPRRRPSHLRQPDTNAMPNKVSRQLPACATQHSAIASQRCLIRRRDREGVVCACHSYRCPYVLGVLVGTRQSCACGGPLGVPLPLRYILQGWSLGTHDRAAFQHITAPCKSFNAVRGCSGPPVGPGSAMSWCSVRGPAPRGPWAVRRSVPRYL
jgi:hypothetical protein